MSFADLRVTQCDSRTAAPARQSRHHPHRKQSIFLSDSGIGTEHAHLSFVEYAAFVFHLSGFLRGRGALVSLTAGGLKVLVLFRSKNDDISRFATVELPLEDT